MFFGDNRMFGVLTEYPLEFSIFLLIGNNCSSDLKSSTGFKLRHANTMPIKSFVRRRYIISNRNFSTAPLQVAAK